ncbi:aminotransferase class V-fold PLP-dependent enzyme [Slackia piriformis]|uniref:aminotransferase class V-fold PLP-dependent enzyme n=1 Tax=Slackia piriformis TaxID=626934 RepID=UPI0026DBAA8E|nr:aminotransferase class V-fold PLP-dependent enzyme [Slackia piriformis]MDO5023236.1 aminotransferase class V-fold PLP-dependent enzyme [Slackia piriformis]
MTMIYLDNAATSLKRPPEVAQAVARAMTEFGGVGRGVHPASLAAGMAVYEARQATSELLGAPCATRVAFAPNATAALNTAICGLLKPGQRALTTAASHNSILRPLFRARDEKNCTVDVAPIEIDGSLDFAAYESMLEHAPALVAATHASNLTGDVYDVARMASLAHDAGALFVLDAAQTAGSLPVDMAQLGVDALCFTGHKGLLGPQGTGGLCVAEGVEIVPFLEGGSGVHTFDERHPLFMPDRLEAGTLNAHGVAGLAAGVAYLRKEGVTAIHERELALAHQMEEAVSRMDGVRLLGGHGGIDRSGIVALTVGNVDSALIADTLAREYGIATRAGAHCAPLMHKALGTAEQGAVRFSFSPFTTADEVSAAAHALAVIAENVREVHHG